MLRRYSAAPPAAIFCRSRSRFVMLAVTVRNPGSLKESVVSQKNNPFPEDAPPCLSRRQALLAASGAAAAAVAGCGEADELGNGVCMGPSPAGAILVSGAEL